MSGYAWQGLAILTVFNSAALLLMQWAVIPAVLTAYAWSVMFVESAGMIVMGLTAVIPIAGCVIAAGYASGYALQSARSRSRQYFLEI